MCQVFASQHLSSVCGGASLALFSRHPAEIERQVGRLCLNHRADLRLAARFCFVYFATQS